MCILPKWKKKKTGKCNECSIQWAHVLDEAGPDCLRANQNGETRHLGKWRLHSPKHHQFPGFLSLPSLESFASFPQFWSAPAVCPQDGSHNSPTQSWYSEITERVGQGQWLRNKSLQEDTEWMRLGSCELCSQLPEALQQLVQGFSIFGARSSVALGGSPVHCKVLSSIPDLHQLDASSPAQERQPKLSPDIANVPMGTGAKSSQVENQWPREHSCGSLTILSAKLRFFSFSSWPTAVHF